MQDFRMETFLAVCRNLNYTKAAEELCITQPAVSQHIRHLEEYYGTRLFVSEGKKDGAYGGRPPTAERGPHYAPR